jgi:putative endopeptidase
MEKWIGDSDFQGYEFFNADAPKLFFQTFAIISREKIRDEAVLTRIKTDPHTPGVHRVNVVLSNMLEFYKAFGVVRGDKLYREVADQINIF